MVHELKIDRKALSIKSNSDDSHSIVEVEYERDSENVEEDNKFAGSSQNIIIIEDFLTQEELHKYDKLLKKLKWSRGNFASDAVIENDLEYALEFSKDPVRRAVDHASFVFGHQLCTYGSTNSVDVFGSFNRWDPGDSLKVHADSQNSSCSSSLNGYVRHTLPPFLIMYSALIYLNDDYEGGELKFTLHDLEIKPKRGTLIMFPGSCMYLHEVKEISAGHRYTHNFFLSNLNLTNVYLDMVRMIAKSSTETERMPDE